MVASLAPWGAILIRNRRNLPRNRLQIVPHTSGCKKIRNDEGYRDQVEIYLEEHTRAEFSHGICEDCMRRLYPGILPPLPGEEGRA